MKLILLRKPSVMSDHEIVLAAWCKNDNHPEFVVWEYYVVDDLPIFIKGQYYFNNLSDALEAFIERKY